MPSKQDTTPALPVSTDDILAAAHRIKGGVVHTTCRHSAGLSKLAGYDLFLKREYRQRTGSFKERGARNALLRLTPEQKQHGVIAASAGNHALALAYHGQQLGIPVTVVMPTFAPMIKVANCRGFDATIVLHGDHIGDAKDHAMTLVDERSLTYINGYDHPDIIAGAGTIGLEMLEQVPDLDAVVVPVGGAGLIAGVAMAINSIRPEVEVIGVEPQRAASYGPALAAGTPVKGDMQPTLADGLAVPVVGSNAYVIAKQHVDRMVTINESDIALAILRLVEMEKAVVEGAGAAGVAAVLGHKLDDLQGKKVGTILCGGNIDTTMLGRIIQRGLAADGRLCRFSAHISDRPGGLAAFTKLLAEQGVSVIDIAHDRVFGGDEIASVSVECKVETRDQDHIDALRNRLDDEGFTTTFHKLPV
ncbi:threonine ammonia-lyase [Phycisphaeraceae bacterium D3-23]